MTLHALAGLPRSGSTMLAAILDQHPDVHVSHTSALPQVIEAVQGVLTSSPEVQVDLAEHPTTSRYRDVYRAILGSWYADRAEPVAIDKGRGWLMFADLLALIDPDARILVCVRDPRDVVASVERTQRASAEFGSPVGATIDARAQNLMEPAGMVGGPCRWTEDLIRRQISNIVFVRYESLVTDPATITERVAKQLGLSPHAFEFDELEHDEPIHEGFNRNKWPHRVRGPVKDQGRSWDDVVSPDIAARIAASYPLFMEHFGYPTGGTNGR